MDEDQQTITALRDAVDASTRERHLHPGAAQRAWAAGRAAPLRSARTWSAVAATVIGVGAGATALATWSHDDDTPVAGGSACHDAVSDAALPTWARDGFGSGVGSAPHITGARGEIVGVLFAQPLRVRQPAGQHNKVLWVAQDPGSGPLTIRATLEGTRTTAVRTVAGGPGPSYLDLPRAGCWTLVLTWSGHQDTAAVPYSR